MGDQCMSHEFTNKVLISVLGFFISVTLMVMSWVAVTTNENNVVISSMNAKLEIQIPQLKKDVVTLFVKEEANAHQLLIINEAKVPFLEQRFDTHIREHEYEYNGKYGKNKDGRTSTGPKRDSEGV